MDQTNIEPLQPLSDKLISASLPIEVINNDSLVRDNLPNKQLIKENENAKSDLTANEQSERSPELAEDVRQKVEELNQKVRNFSFSYSEVGNRVQVEIRDGSGELIRQIPSEEVMNLLEKVNEFQGKIFDETV